MSIVHGGDPSRKEAILDPNGAVSVYEGRKIPTGRRRRSNKHYSGFGDLDPVNTRYALLVKGELDVSELDNDELAYGVPRCDDGKFSIKAAYDAAHLPMRIKSKLKKELMKRAERMLEGNLLAAIGRIAEIATGPMSDDKDAMKASEWIVNRVMGKAPDIVVHTQDKKFEVVIEDISRGSRRASREARGLDSNPPLEAEIVPDSE